MIYHTLAENGLNIEVIHFWSSFLLCSCWLSPFLSTWLIFTVALNLVNGEYLIASLTCRLTWEKIIQWVISWILYCRIPYIWSDSHNVGSIWLFQLRFWSALTTQCRWWCLHVFGVCMETGERHRENVQTLYRNDPVVRIEPRSLPLHHCQPSDMTSGTNREKMYGPAKSKMIPCNKSPK